MCVLLDILSQFVVNNASESAACAVRHGFSDLSFISDKPGRYSHRNVCEDDIPSTLDGECIIPFHFRKCAPWCISMANREKRRAHATVLPSGAHTAYG